MAIALSILAPNAIAQSTAADGQRPASAGRVVRAYDFEEQDYNPLPVPLGWIRGQEDPDVPRVRPGFPIWNHAVLDYNSPAFSGIGSVKLPTEGGSTSLTLRRGEINIFPNADYLVSARVRTKGLKYAKARVVARLLDQRGELIPQAESITPLVSTENQWQQTALEIEGIYPNAAFIQIEFQLLQPKQQFEENAIEAFAVWDQDFDGAAWFDNLIIAQLPRLEISTGSPGNIVESSTSPSLNILVRDLTGDSIIARARIFDVHGQEVDSQILADGTRRVQTSWTPNLPGFGWYRAMLEVVVDNQLVGVRTLDYIWSAPNEIKINSGMFAIHAQLTDPTIAESAPILIRGAGVSRASLEVWSYTTTKEELDPQAPITQAIIQLINEGVRVSIGLSELPRALAKALSVDPDEVVPVFAGPSTAWLTWGSTMLDQFGQAISNWQFGDQPTQEEPAALNLQLDAIHNALIGYVPGPVLVTPWSIDRPIDPAIVRANTQLSIIDNPATNESAMGIVVDEWVQYTKVAQQAPTTSTSKSNHPPALAMMLSPNQSPGLQSEVEVWSSVGALARKAISFWWHAKASGLGGERFELELTDAWWISPGKRGQVMPAPELVVWRTLATHLANRQAIEQLDLIPGVRMLIAGPKPDESNDATGIMILWLEEPTIDPIYIDMPLATNDVTRLDVFGNKQVIPVEYSGELNLPIHRIEIGRSPIIIQGVNTQLVRFLGALRITPGKLQASSGVHKHALQLSNPWPFSVRGRVYIVEPGGYTGPPGSIDRSWEIAPRVIPFVLDPNEERSIPVDIAYSLGEIAGRKMLAFDVELEADQDYPLMRIERSIELGLDGIDLTISARRGDDGVTVLSARVTNNLDTNQDFELIAIPPRESRIRRSVNGIKPGEKISRQFAFTMVNPGDQIVVALLHRDTSIRLNKAIIIP